MKKNGFREIIQKAIEHVGTNGPVFSQEIVMDSQEMKFPDEATFDLYVEIEVPETPELFNTLEGRTGQIASALKLLIGELLSLKDPLDAPTCVVGLRLIHASYATF